MSTTTPYRVRAVACDHHASEEEVYEALKRATAPLDRAWAKLKAAKRITIKFNQAWAPERLQWYEGNLRELVDYKVARATLRLLRENTSAELTCTEIGGDAQDTKRPFEEMIPLLPLLKEYGVRLVDGNRPPLKTYAVPGGGLMFQQYLLSESVVDTDAFVSVQKIKNHAFMGVTLCMKNLFGLPPTPPLGRSRQYFHHIIRLSYVLVDLARIIQPTLNILDGLVAQSGREWGGDGRIANTLVAGDQVIATDACATHLMGFDPLSDWPGQPFVRDRSSILVAHQAGFGAADLQQIDWQSEVQAPIAAFGTAVTDPFETVLAWRRSTCEQALYYRDHMKELVDRYAGQYILLQDNEVRWHDTQSAFHLSRRDLAGRNKLSAMWFKYVDPQEAEGEHFEVYEQNLKMMESMAT